MPPPPSTDSADLIGRRPSRRPTRAELADWQARTYPALARFAAPPAGFVVLDDVIPDEDEAFADPDVAAAAALEELAVWRAEHPDR